MKDPDSMGISLATSLPASLFRNFYQSNSTMDLYTNIDRPSQPIAHGLSSFSISPSCSNMLGFQPHSPSNITKRSNIRKYRRKLCSSAPDLIQLQRIVDEVSHYTINTSYLRILSRMPFTYKGCYRGCKVIFRGIF